VDRQDTLLALQQAHIDQYGWAVTAVMPTAQDDGAPFAYTAGLTAHGHPEFVIAGLRPHISHALLNDMAARVHDHGELFHHGQYITDLLHGYEAVLIDGPITGELYPGTACGRYGQDRVRLRQIVWPDPNGRYPWDRDYNLPPGTQPILGRL
jgi:hypothetical protein